MVGRLQLIMCFVGVFPFASFAATLLQLSLANSDIQWGDAFELELLAQGFDRDLSQIDMAVFSKDFAVVIEETISESSDRRQVMLLKLYPRQTGNFIIPSLTFNNRITAPLPVTVSDAMIKGKVISVSTTVSTTSLWQRQQLVISVAIKTPDKFAKLKNDAFNYPATEVFPIPASRQWQTREGQHESVLQLGWVLFPQQSGEVVIELPAIYYMLHGQIQRNFYLPKIVLAIKPLPVYVPPTIPVGKVDVDSYVVKPNWLGAHEAAHWVVNLSSTQLAPQLLPSVLRQIESNNSIEFLQVQSLRKQEVGNNGVRGQVSHDLSFKALRNGNLQLPDLRIQYFDPHLGRLKTTYVPSETVLVIDTVWLTILAIVIAFLLFTLVNVGMRCLLKFLKYRKSIKSALNQCQCAQDVYALRKGLKQYARAQNWPENVSLKTWYQYWQQAFNRGNQIGMLLQELSTACYGAPRIHSFEKLRDSIVEQIGLSRRRRTWHILRRF